MSPPRRSSASAPKPPNPYVAYSYQDSWLMQMGGYVVQERDLPLYQVDLDADGRIIAEELARGRAMRKHHVESTGGSVMRLRRILGEAALLAAMVLTASWLFRG